MRRFSIRTVPPWIVALGLVSVMALFAPFLVPDAAAPLIQLENAFLKLGNIKGKAITQGFQDQIVFLNMSYQITQQGKWEAGERLSGRVTVFGDVKIVKEMDNASPLLALACATKEQFPRADISLVSGRDVYLLVTLEGVIVSSVSIDYQNGTPRPIEVITLNYQKATWQWGTAKAGYDLRQNVKM